MPTAKKNDYDGYVKNNLYYSLLQKEMYAASAAREARGSLDFDFDYQSFAWRMEQERERERERKLEEEKIITSMMNNVTKDFFIKSILEYLRLSSKEKELKPLKLESNLPDELFEV